MREIDEVPGRAAHRLYVHVVWPTLGRIPLITSEGRDALERHLIVLGRRLDVEPVCVRALADRAHVLLRFKPGHAVAAVVARLKEGSEAALNADGHAVRWGRGYAAASVGGEEVRRAMRRIVRLPDISPRPPRHVFATPPSARHSARQKTPVHPRDGVDASHPFG